MDAACQLSLHRSLEGGSCAASCSRQPAHANLWLPRPRVGLSSNSPHLSVPWHTPLPACNTAARAHVPCKHPQPLKEKCTRRTRQRAAELLPGRSGSFPSSLVTKENNNSTPTQVRWGWPTTTARPRWRSAWAWCCSSASRWARTVGVRVVCLLYVW